MVPPDWELFYGGARGGGKSDTVLGLILAHCIEHRQSAKALIIRSEYKQLRDLRERGRVIFGAAGARWVGGEESCFIFPNGARIYLGHCRTTKDAAKWQGWEITFLAIEELTNWPDEEPIRMLHAAIRSAKGVQTQWMATGNPGGPGHPWVKEKWIEGAVPYEPRPVLDEEGDVLLDGNGQPRLQVFIPARVEDNPALLESDPSYVINLKRQAKHLARAWLLGDWDVAPGAYLESCWDPSVHLIDDIEPPWWWPRWVAIDWGTARPYAVGWLCHRPDDNAIILYRELYGWGGRANVGTREGASEVADRIIRINETAERPDAKWYTGVGDANMWNEDGTERGVSPASVMRDRGLMLRKGPNRTPGSRVGTLNVLVDLLRTRRFLVARSCKHWLRTVPVLAPDPDNPEDVDTNSEDHALDMTRYGIWLWETVARPDRLPDTARRGRTLPPRIAGERSGIQIDQRTLQPVVRPGAALEFLDDA